MKERIGITTTIPIEILYAAGKIPVDLNNIFITSENPGYFVTVAEEAGYPRSVCGWIKGIYGAVVSFEGTPEAIDEVVAVTQGDCSNTHALMETLELRRKKTFPFAYPFDRDRESLSHELTRLGKHFGPMKRSGGVDWDRVAEIKCRLDRIRKKLLRLDELTWQENRVHGLENHTFLVSGSDFEGDPEGFKSKLDRFLDEVSVRKPLPEGIRIGYIGVPPILSGIYEVVEEYGGRVVFNETQRQFAMIAACDSTQAEPGWIGLDMVNDADSDNPCETLVTQYINFTYPYGVFSRIRDIAREIERRRLEGIIHYVQSFCFRQIEDLIFREKLPVPVLTIEGESPAKLDQRTRIRLESFMEMLQARR